MEKLIILVDQDGVLFDYDKRLMEIVAQEEPDFVALPREAHTEFNTEMNYPERYRALMEEIVHRPGFFRSLPPIDGALDAMRTLLAAGHDVRICTAPKKRFENCVAEKLASIKEHLGQEFVERTIITRDKTLVHGDYLIDDKPEVIGVRRPSWEHLVFDRPYNKNVLQRRLTWANYKKVLGL